MAEAFSIESDQRQANLLMAQIRRNSKETGASMRSSLAWGGRKVSESLRSATPKGKRLRPVVENPEAGQDARLAKYGVMVYRQQGNPNPAFVPIRGGSDAEKIRFVSKTTGQVLVRDRVTGKVSQFAYDDQKQALDVMRSKKRKIGRRGFAAKSWTFLNMRMRRGGEIRIDGVPDMGGVSWTGSKDDPQVTITNKVSYMTTILKGGGAVIGSAMEAAAKGMAYQIDNKIRKKMGAK
jgi:hypothetical protein